MILTLEAFFYMSLKSKHIYFRHFICHLKKKIHSGIYGLFGLSLQMDCMVFNIFVSLYFF